LDAVADKCRNDPERKVGTRFVQHPIVHRVDKIS
jgi:hypothetical protein